MLFWTNKRLLALVATYGLMSALVCAMPAWSQKPSENSPIVSASTAPLTPQTPNSNATWNLTDILWGISRLQNSPQKLSAEQIKTVRPTVKKVVEGTQTVKGFETKVKGILTAEQLAYIKHLASTGELAKVPDDLPQAQPGQDPLVEYVIATLEKKIKNK